jgi:hypothetical protein
VGTDISHARLHRPAVDILRAPSHAKGAPRIQSRDRSPDVYVASRCLQTMPSRPISAEAASTTAGSTSVQFGGSWTTAPVVPTTAAIGVWPTTGKPVVLDAISLRRLPRAEYGQRVMSRPSTSRMSNTKYRTGTRRRSSGLGRRFYVQRRCRRLGKEPRPHQAPQSPRPEPRACCPQSAPR